MSNRASNPSPVGIWITAIAVVACFLVAGIVIYNAYVPARATWGGPAGNLGDEERVAAGLLTPSERSERLEELRARESQELASYGWIDRDNGVVRLPIDRAIELLIQEHGRGEGAN